MKPAIASLSAKLLFYIVYISIPCAIAVFLGQLIFVFRAKSSMLISFGLALTLCVVLLTLLLSKAHALLNRLHRLAVDGVMLAIVAVLAVIGFALQVFFGSLIWVLNGSLGNELEDLKVINSLTSFSFYILQLHCFICIIYVKLSAKHIAWNILTMISLYQLAIIIFRRLQAE
jgi:hypothetical protein